MEIRAFLALIILLLSNFAWSFSEALTAKEQIECAYAQSRYSFLGQDTVECTEDYLLFESPNKSRERSELKVSTFNVIRLGTDQAVFKHYGITADIINQWDLVSVVEIMPTPAANQAHNKKIDEVLQQFHHFSSSYSEGQINDYINVIEESFQMPGYLKLLKALRELDPSWSLVMASTATGDVPNSLEMTGFYYRSGRVTNVNSSYCGGKRGCMVPIRSGLVPLMSRIPFSATFQSGKLRFQGVSLHLRFRENAKECEPGEKPTAPVTDKNGRNTQGCEVFSKEAKSWLKKFKDVKDARFRGRFIELGIISQALKRSKENVMILGDFNLEHKPEGHYENATFWKRAIGGKKEVFVHTPTSISRNNGLSQEYDHFIFNPEEISRCNPESAQSFNFLLDLKRPETDVPALKGLARLLREIKTSPEDVYDKFFNQLNTRKVLLECREKKCDWGYFFDNDELYVLVKDYRHRIIETKKSVPYKVYEDLVSDHIPIVMKCVTN